MKNLIIVLFVTLTLFGCSKEENKNGNTNTCADIGCSKELRYVSILVKDGNNNPYALDSFYSILESENKVLVQNSNFEDAGITNMREEGEYVIATDNDDIIDIIPSTGADVKFIGFKNGTKVADKTFLVGHDCCHVKMVSKDTVITIP